MRNGVIENDTPSVAYRRQLPLKGAPRPCPPLEGWVPR